MARSGTNVTGFSGSSVRPPETEGFRRSTPLDIARLDEELAALLGFEGSEEASKIEAWRADLALCTQIRTQCTGVLKDEILEVVERWANLPGAVRIGVLAMIRASS
jgi:hypothetical protein